MAADCDGSGGLVASIDRALSKISVVIVETASPG